MFFGLEMWSSTFYIRKCKIGSFCPGLPYNLYNFLCWLMSGVGFQVVAVEFQCICDSVVIHMTRWLNTLLFKNIESVYTRAHLSLRKKLISQTFLLNLWIQCSIDRLVPQSQLPQHILLCSRYSISDEPRYQLRAITLAFLIAIISKSDEVSL